jgi:hypothetical protein
MILFFGTRPGKQEIKQLTQCACPFCQQQGSLTAITQANYAHLFWVKLFKISTNTYAECSHCKRMYYENEFTAEMAQELSQTKNQLEQRD